MPLTYAMVETQKKSLSNATTADMNVIIDQFTNPKDKNMEKLRNCFLCPRKL
jgi:hypothetical protein